MIILCCQFIQANYILNPQIDKNKKYENWGDIKNISFGIIRYLFQFIILSNRESLQEIFNRSIKHE